MIIGLKKNKMFLSGKKLIYIEKKELKEILSALMKLKFLKVNTHLH